MYVNDAILDKEIGGRLTIFWLVKGIFVLTPKEIDALYDAISHVCK